MMGKEKFSLNKGVGGMSNRMRSLFTAMLHAQLNGRTLIVDWRDETYSDGSNNVFHNFFTISEMNYAVEIPDADSVRPAIWQGNLDKSLDKMWSMHGPHPWVGEELYKKYSIDIGQIDFPEDLIVLWCYEHKLDTLRKHFKGKFAELGAIDNTAIFRKMLRENLILNKNIRKKVDDFKAKHFKDKVVGVHVRYTDLKPIPLDEYYSSVDKLIDRYSDAQIFLATDSRKVQSEFQKRYKNIIITDKWLPEKSEKLHGHPKCPDKIENGIKALVDMYLLAECDYLIFCWRSTFAVMSYYISDLPSTNLIDLWE